MSLQRRPLPRPVNTTRLRSGGAVAGNSLARVWQTPGAKPALVAFSFFVAIAILAPWVAPYGPFENVRNSNGELARLLPPSLDHPFGTTTYGNDLFSQVIWGTRRALSVGFTAALVSVAIGVNVGLISGYVGGWVDAVLMRITDTAYALPFLPLAIVLVGLLGRSDGVLLLAISLLFWRTTARVIRSQVLSLKQRTYIRAAVVGGARPRRVLFVHLAPNVVSMAILYGIFLVAESVLAEASLSFLGLAPTESISWGTVMNAAFTSSEIRGAWWWAFFPGLAVMLFVLCMSLLGRAYESSQRSYIEGRQI